MLKLLMAAATAAATLVSAQARAASDKPLFAPAPAWVKPLEIPKVPAEGPSRLLTLDGQLRFSKSEEVSYNATVIAVNDAAGLAQVGAINLAWRPDSQALTLHRLEIHRGDKVIDLLADHSAVTVLRREPNLEAATLDGALTASILTSGLQVGDILVTAYSIADHDPVRRGHSEGWVEPPKQVPISRLRIRAIWAPETPMRWKAAAPLGTPKLVESADGTELLIERADYETPAGPPNAPDRFQHQGRITFSDYESWRQLSAQFADIFEPATRIAPDSPLRMEIARIAAASSDPRVRAGMALQLVESQIRYFNLALGAGGLVPASADQTWARRFGDCKAKSVLLVALLRGLGIEAAPALVSSTRGDGLAAALPAVGDFDHAIVRARIGGAVVWLDGTRVGDEGLEDLPAPKFQHALPLEAQGSDLAPIDDPPPARPLTETSLELDMSKGPDAPAPARVTLVLRGDAGALMRLAWDAAPPAERDKRFIDGMMSQSTLYSFTTVKGGWDAAQRGMVLEMTGTAKIPWVENADNRQFFIPDTGVGGDVSLRRPDGPDKDAPYVNTWPYYSVAHMKIVLPDHGRGYSLEGGGPVDTTVGGSEFKRTLALKDGVATVEVASRNVAREYPAAEAAADETALRKLAAKGVWIQAPPGANATAAAASPVSQPARPGADPLATEASAAAYAGAATRAGQAEEARRRADAGLAKYPHATGLLFERVKADLRLDDLAGARRDVARAVSLDPESEATRAARAAVEVREGDFAAAAADYDAAIAKGPTSVATLWMAGVEFEQAGRYETALAYYDKAISRFPMSKNIASMLNERCWVRAEMGRDLEFARIDCDAALGALPNAPDIHDSRGLVELRQGQFDASIGDYDAALAVRPQMPTSLYGRGLGKLKKGLKEEGQADIAAAEKADPKIAARFAAWGVTPP